MKTNKMCAILGNVETTENLMPLIEKRPVATLPFDCKYRLVDFPLSSIANAQIRSVFTIFNNFHSQSIFDHIRSGKEWNLDALGSNLFPYFLQEFQAKKEAGGNYYGSMIDFLHKSKSSYTVVLGSSMLCNIDLKAVLRNHQAQDKDVTVVFKKVDAAQVAQGDAVLKMGECGGYVEAVDIGATEESSEEKENLFMEIFLLKTELLIAMLVAAQATGETEILPRLIRGKLSELGANAYEYTGYLSNINSVKAYYEANMDMLEPTKFNSLLHASQKVFTKVKNEVPTYYSASCHVKNSQFATGCLIEGTVENSLISRKVVIYEEAVVKNSIIFPNSKILPGAVVEYAILDKNVIVGADAVICGTREKPIVIAKNSEVYANLGGGLE